MPPAIAARKLTHINFAFARIDGEGRIAFEDPGYEASVQSLLALKRDNPALKVLVSVGGWGADGFSDAALTEASRERFAQSGVELLRRTGADGLDIDWEYPGQGVAGIRHRPQDRQNFTLLLRTLRQRLNEASVAAGRKDGDRYLLTIASADREFFEFTEMERLHVFLDWVNVMGYDFFNSLTETTGHHAGLYPSPHAAPTDRNANASIRQHVSAGIPARKLVLGVAFYGRRFAGVDPANDGLNQRYERFVDAPSYRQLVEELIDRQGFERRWDDVAKAPFLWNGKTQEFISYEDPQSIGLKADYVREHSLGGMMFWELSQDRDGALLDVIAESLSAPAR
jgi:chitinase